MTYSVDNSLDIVFPIAGHDDLRPFGMVTVWPQWQRSISLGELANCAAKNRGGDVSVMRVAQTGMLGVRLISPRERVARTFLSAKTRRLCTNILPLN